MPDIIVFIITTTLTISGILSFIFSCVDGTLDYKVSWLVLPVSLLVWISMYGVTDWKYIDHTGLTVHNVDNIDVVKVNNELINLNDYFGRSFKDGDKITIQEKSDVCYYGIFPVDIKGRYKLGEQIISEKEMLP